MFEIILLLLLLAITIYIFSHNSVSNGVTADNESRKLIHILIFGASNDKTTWKYSP